jgi:hypothetical protein
MLELSRRNRLVRPATRRVACLTEWLKSSDHPCWLRIQESAFFKALKALFYVVDILNIYLSAGGIITVHTAPCSVLRFGYLLQGQAFCNYFSRPNAGFVSVSCRNIVPHV